MTPPMMTREKRKARVAILVNLANSVPLMGLAAELRVRGSLLVFVSTSASDSEATVEALVDDLNLVAIIYIFFKGVDISIFFSCQ